MGHKKAPLPKKGGFRCYRCLPGHRWDDLPPPWDDLPCPVCALLLEEEEEERLEELELSCPWPKDFMTSAMLLYWRSSILWISSMTTFSACRCWACFKRSCLSAGNSIPFRFLVTLA